MDRRLAESLGPRAIAPCFPAPTGRVSGSVATCFTRGRTTFYGPRMAIVSLRSLYRGLLAAWLVVGTCRCAAASPAGGAAQTTSAGTPAGIQELIPKGGSVPVVDTTPVDVAGRIVFSSRGHAGPVRIEIEASDGKRVTALLATDDVCNRLGLSLKAGETVVLRGSMFNGPRPALITTAVIVDGKPVALRGKDIDGPGPTLMRAGKAQPPPAAAPAARP